MAQDAEQLKLREDRLAKNETTYAEREAKANANFAERQKKIQEEADNKVKLARESLLKEHKESLAKQEGRFMTKRKELQDRIKSLEDEEKRMVSLLKRTQEVQTRAENRIKTLEKDLGDFQQQVGPAVERVEEARSSARHARDMSRQRQLMLKSLVKRAYSVGDKLRIEVPNFAAAGSDDEAAYTLFFEQFLGGVEEVAKSFDERVVEESRDLLVIATSRIFSNLVRRQPLVDLEALTARVDISDGARKAAEAYANKFNQAVVDVVDDGEEGAEEEERAAVGEGSSKGARV